MRWWMIGKGEKAFNSMFELEINNILTITIKPYPLLLQAIIPTVTANGHSS